MSLMKNFMRDRWKVSEERLEICRACENFNKESSRCSSCGCFMDYKTLLHSAECPLKKWGKYVVEEKEE